jgi:hypothetical protein
MQNHSAIAQRLFERLNKKYFGSTLPEYRIVACEPTTIDSGFTAGKHERRQLTIYLSDELRGTALRRILLHEMAHANSNDYHSGKWKEEMRRIGAVEPDTHHEEEMERELSLYD